ncbi:SDR family NAD(P)-dependent oxidoreductase [Seonamhaeicola marinus]|uniref:SDR family NAD(P)-dependent oxidoreductase n=1 Tax=Seonamhaeicola marinus TaxID=1912246 RepID=A0A5D0I746_9FLAO|nr:SDR family NAD(P)-dependent oxidoreductase [Seonamhaeicola marinus]TYA78721.1 SDR family NAD(P)-dependent oxidoreductase [Seonamhaeicola marinus]
MEQIKGTKEQYALITGASQGLGRAFAYTLAKQGINIILVSLPGQNLIHLANQLSHQYKIKTECYETNFQSDSNVEKLCMWLNKNFSIFILINNAGTGGTRKFSEVSTNYIDTIIQVNVKATSLITHRLLPNLMKQRKGYILNVSSIAAFSPVGYKTVYPASKSFVHSFSLGLSEELRDTNISVSVINPGAMKTNEEITARIEKQGLLGRLTLLDPKKVAQLSLKKMFRGKKVIMLNPLSWVISIVLPTRFKVSMMTRIIKRELTVG